MENSGVNILNLKTRSFKLRQSLQYKRKDGRTSKLSALQVVKNCLYPQQIVSNTFLRIYQSASALMHAGKEDYQLGNLLSYYLFSFM